MTTTNIQTTTSQLTEIYRQAVLQDRLGDACWGIYADEDGDLRLSQGNPAGCHLLTTLGGYDGWGGSADETARWFATERQELDSLVELAAENEVVLTIV